MEEKKHHHPIPTHLAHHSLAPITYLLIAIFLISIGVLVGYMVGSSLSRKYSEMIPNLSPTPGAACTMDAKLCPDGTSVGRIPPSCEFLACPDITPTLAAQKLQVNDTRIFDIVSQCTPGIEWSSIKNDVWKRGLLDQRGQLRGVKNIQGFSITSSQDDHGLLEYANSCEKVILSSGWKKNVYHSSSGVDSTWGYETPDESKVLLFITKTTSTISCPNNKTSSICYDNQVFFAEIEN